MRNIGIANSEGLFIINFDGCKDLTGFIESFEKAVNRIGFSNFAFVLFSKYKIKQFGNFEEELIKYYTEDRFFLDDPLINHFRNKDEFMYTDVIKSHLLATPYMDEFTYKRVMWLEKLEKYCYYSVAFIPVNLPNNERCLLWLAKKDATPENVRATIAAKDESISSVVLTSINFIFDTLPEVLAIRSVDSNGILGTKPLRLMKVMAKNDLQLKEAASKICISLDTANKHIASAKRTFQANTQVAALYRAIQEGVIDPFEEATVDSTTKERKNR